MQVEVRHAQAMMQQVLLLLSHGYTYWRLDVRPEKKKENWPDIDAKIVRKYPILGYDKYRRARRKQKGLMNARLIRWERHAVLLMTSGEDDIDMTSYEKVRSAQKYPPRLPLHPAGDLQFRQREGSWTVQLDEETYENLKALLLEAGRGPKNELIRTWSAEVEARLPSFRGLYRDKRKLRENLIRRTNCSAKELKIAQKRPIFQVYYDKTE